MSPYVFTNFAVSLDGKVTTAEHEHIPPSAEDAYRMDYHRSLADAALVGAGTLRVFHKPACVLREKFKKTRLRSKRSPQPHQLVLATKLDFDLKWPFFKRSDFQRTLCVPRGTKNTKKFAPYCDFLFLDEKKPVPPQILAYLKKLKLKTLLIEGGGNIMFPWVEGDHIDEWNITLVPKIIGGKNAPTMVEGLGFSAKHIPFYKLKSLKKVKEEIFLQYIRK